MKSINLKLGIVSLGLLLSVSCKKEQTLKSITINQESESSTNVEVDSKKIFGESNYIFDNVSENEDDYLNYDINSLKKENNYFVFTDYVNFFKALKRISLLNEAKYSEFTSKYDFKCRKNNSFNVLSKNSVTENIPVIPFQSYSRLLSENGTVKIGNELHIYRSKSLVIIKNGNSDLINDGLALSDSPLNNKFFSVSQITNILIHSTNNLVYGVVDGNHITSLSTGFSAVLVTSPFPGLADAYNYSFDVAEASMAPVNVANFPCDIVLNYFRCILKYNDYLGAAKSINSVPFTQGGLSKTLTTPPTSWVISANVGQALRPVGSGFTGSYCAQVGCYEKYSTPGYIGTGGAFQLKCILNSCLPF